MPQTALLGAIEITPINTKTQFLRASAIYDHGHDLIIGTIRAIGGKKGEISPFSTMFSIFDDAICKHAEVQWRQIRVYRTAVCL